MKTIPHFDKLKHVSRIAIFLIMAIPITGMADCITGPMQGIRDWYDLDDVRNNLSGNYVLMNDLDSTTPGYEELASPTANGDKGWDPIGAWGYGFAGSFDGQSHQVRDLFIARPDDDWVGLFSIADGTVKNLGVVNADVLGRNRVGALVGQNRGSVVNCYSAGTVGGVGFVGGLVGLDYGPHESVPISSVLGDSNSDTAIMSDSYSAASVSGEWSIGGLVGNTQSGDILRRCYATGVVTGQTWVGGLVGVDLGPIDDCYSTGSVTGNSSVGGLAGNLLYGDVNNSYSSGNVTGYKDVGGLVGTNGGSVSNSFWDIQTSGQTTSAGGTGKNTTEMQDIATFASASWSIVAVLPESANATYIWNIVNNVTYPFLSWQS